MTTFTQTLAWCTSCAELAHSAHSFTTGDVISHLIGSSPEQTLCRPRSYPWAHLFDSLLPFYFHLFLPVLLHLLPPTTSCSLSSTTRSSWQVCATPPTLRVRTPTTPSLLFTGYEPNLLTFGELNDSSVPFSFMIPSADQDVDDVALGKMLTEAHRGQVDYCEPEGMSVSQSVVVCCVRWIRAT